MRASHHLPLILNLRRYNDERPLTELAKRLHRLYGDIQAQRWFLTSGGRSALELVLTSLKARPGDEIIVQSLTCVTAINPVIWAGLTPVYADIDQQTYGLDPAAVKRTITPRTRAIIIQHTFGQSADLASIIKVAREHDLIVIEDCAHALGLPLVGQRLGTHGDAAVLSFGVDKMLPTVFGGALIVNRPQLASAVEERYADWQTVARSESLRWLLYPFWRRTLALAPAMVRGKMRGLLVRLGWLRLAIDPKEYRAERTSSASKRLSGVHARLVLDALTDLTTNMQRRRRVMGRYQKIFAGQDHLIIPPDDDVLIKYPLLCATSELRDHILTCLRHRGLEPITWYYPTLFPAATDRAALRYDPSDCPIAENVASRIITLPTDVAPAYATMIANELIAATARFQSQT